MSPPSADVDETSQKSKSRSSESLISKPTPQYAPKVLTPDWADGDVFFVERTSIIVSEKKGKQTTTVCKFNLKVDKIPDGFRIRQTGLLPGPLSVDASNEDVNKYFALLNCLMDDMIVDNDFNFMESHGISYLPQIQAAFRAHYAQPQFEKGLGDLVVEKLINERKVRQKTEFFWQMLMQRWMGASIEELGGQLVSCADGTPCVDFTHRQDIDAEALGKEMNAEITIESSESSMRIITSLDHMYPEFMESKSRIHATVQPPNSHIIRIDSSSSDTYRISKVDQAPEGVYENPNGMTDAEKREFNERLPPTFWSCAKAEEDKGAYRVQIDIHANGSVNGLTPLRELPDGMLECMQSSLKDVKFPQSPSSIFIDVTL